MAQFGRPSVDTVNEGYTDQGGGGANLYTTLDEVVRDDADYIKSVVAPTSDVYVTKLTAVEDPLSSANHIIRYAYGKDAAGGAQIDQTVQLRQDYVNEGAQGTLIHEAVHTNVAVAWVAGTFTLTGPEADSITNYPNLYVRVVSNQV